MENIIGPLLQYLVFSPFVVGICLWLYSRKYAHLPGDYGFPIVGNLYNVVYSFVYGSPRDLHERIKKVFDLCGNVACLWTGPIISICVADPSFVEEMAYHPAAVNKEQLVYNKVKLFLIGAFTKSNTDSKWKQYRKNMNDSLKKHRLESYHDIFVRRSMELVKVFAEQNGVFDVQPIITLSSVDTSLETQFGFSLDFLLNKNYALIKEISKLINVVGQALANPLYAFISWFYLRYIDYSLIHLRAVSKKIIDILMKNYESRKSEGLSTDAELPIGETMFIHGMERKVPLDRIELELKEIVFVSSYTTGALISGLLMFLAASPEIQEKAWEEQRDIFGISNRMPSHEDIKRMDYLERIIKEGCRILSVPVLARSISEETKIGGYRIPKNSTVIIGSHQMRMSPDYWDNPTKFDPDHFLKERVAHRHKFANVAFGVLPRHCPGVPYVMNSSKVMLSAILRSFKISTPLKPEDLRFHTEILMELDGPYLISCERRA